MSVRLLPHVACGFSSFGRNHPADIPRGRNNRRVVMKVLGNPGSVEVDGEGQLLARVAGAEGAAGKLRAAEVSRRRRWNNIARGPIAITGRDDIPGSPTSEDPGSGAGLPTCVTASTAGNL